jgi:hypothetical protein
MKGFKLVIGIGAAHSRFLSLKKCPIGCGSIMLNRSTVERAMRPDEGGNQTRDREDVCRCAKASVCANERNGGVILRRAQAQVSGAGTVQAVVPQIDQHEASVFHA